MKTIGIIGAMEVEVAILKEKMELYIFNVMYMVIREKYNTDIILLDMKGIN